MVTNVSQDRSGFTLVELLVVIIIIALLSALTLGAARTGGIRAKEDSARNFVVHISEFADGTFEELDDQGFTKDEVGPSYAVRWQIPTYNSMPCIHQAVIQLHRSVRHIVHMHKVSVLEAQLKVQSVCT